MTKTYYGKELYHHGIEGMRWGVRHGPPYPLSSSTHNKVTSKAKSNGNGSTVGSAAAANLAAFGVGVVTLLAAKAFQELNGRATRNKDRKKDEGKTFSDLSELENAKTLKNTSKENAVKVNQLDTRDRSTTANCTNCTMATELRLRGYDVEAQHLTGGRRSKGMFSDAFVQNVNWEYGTELDKSKDGLTFKKASNESTTSFKERRIKELSNEIAAKSGKSTSGAISFASPYYAMGHVFNYVVDSKGKVTFLDGQTNKADASDNINKLDASFKFTFARLDNLEFSDGVLDYIRQP